MTTESIIFLAFCALLLLWVILSKKPFSSTEKDSYRGKAKLIARFTDEQGCFLCQFEQDGKIVNAIYGNDNPDLKVGDEVDVVWDGWCHRLPQVMDKEIYDRCMQLDLERSDTF